MLQGFYIRSEDILFLKLFIFDMNLGSSVVIDNLQSPKRLLCFLKIIGLHSSHQYMPFLNHPYCFWSTTWQFDRNREHCNVSEKASNSPRRWLFEFVFSLHFSERKRSSYTNSSRKNIGSWKNIKRIFSTENRPPNYIVKKVLKKST